MNKFCGKQRGRNESFVYSRQNKPVNSFGCSRQYVPNNSIGFAMQYEPDNAYGYEMQYEPVNAYAYANQCGYKKQHDYDMHHEKACPMHRKPLIPCKERPCHFCGFVLRKSPHSGKCCRCKVWQCGYLYVYQCSDCGAVFWIDCKNECWKKDPRGYYEP